MKRLCILLAALLVFPSAGFTAKTDTKRTVEHFFTHCLIAHPEIAFRPGNKMGAHYDADCLTPKEFKAILTQMYENGYALIDAGEVYAVENGIAVKRAFDFPAGKKPMLLSFDDVVYDSKKAGLGMADRLVIDDGRVRAYTEGMGAHDEEFVPILESFVAAHPDFSVRGARGMLCVTGFDGVLGYRTNRGENVGQAKAVADRLKADGWRFVCHSYAHRHMKKITPAVMRDEMEKWNKEVAPIVGATDLYAYPYGERAFDAKQDVLAEYGYRFFFGVGERPYFSTLTENGRSALFMDRCPMDGVSLRKHGEEYRRVFDCKRVYDDARPVKM